MKSIKCIIVMLLIPALANADVYMKKDADGSISYSDQPQPNADKITLQPVNTLNAKDNAPVMPEQPDSQSLEGQPAQPPTQEKAEAYKPKEEREAYKSVTISSPKDQETLQNPVTIDVSATSDPALQTKFHDKYALYVNGTQFGEPSETAAFSIPRDQVPRGTYTLQVAILDENKQALITSSMITVFIKYHTIAV